MVQMQENHGKLLFEDDYNYRFNRRAWALVGSVAISGGIFLGVFLWLSSDDIGHFPQDGLIICSAFIILGLFVILSRRTYHKFRIYENGISFTEPGKFPFMQFDQINYIIKDGPDFVIVRRKAPNENHSLYIASRVSRSAAGEFIGNWTRFLEMFEIRLKQTHPDQDEAMLIRMGPELLYTRP
jgi:hypothetical protein